MDRNGWPKSIGISGRIESEMVADLERNTHVQMCLEQYAELSKEMLTPLIAIITVYIAWQQWKTNKKKLFLDLYDRRLKIYEELRQILSIILRDARASYDDLMKFRRAVSEADFLFGSEITSYIDGNYSAYETADAPTFRFDDMNAGDLPSNNKVKASVAEMPCFRHVDK